MPWSYSYNLAGNQTSATTPDSGTTTLTYDGDGNLLSVTDARGKTVSYTFDADSRKIGEYDTTGGAQETSSDELASWTYDTLAKGLLTASTAYVGGTSGSAYTEQVLGYNSYGLATGTETIIPASAGALAGTYKQGDTYSAYGDVPTSYFDYAAAGLPAETVNIGYNGASQPVSVTSSLWDYVPSLSYTELGQPLEYALGTTSQPAWMTDTYDQNTGLLTAAQVQTGTSPVTVDNTTYGYDADSLITSESDTAAGGPSQIQCFTYNYLGQLTSAWSQSSSGCPSAGSQSAEAGAAAPYFDTYTYNAEGNLTARTSTPASGAATTITSAYPSAGSAQPHAVSTESAVTGSGPAATTSYTYTPSGQTASTTPPTGPASNLTWNDAGQLAAITAAGSQTPTATYTYDADNNLLLQSDSGAGTTTLYLGDEQITATTSGSTTTLSAVRYYTIGGVTAAVRTSGGTISYLVADQHGTDSLSIDSATLAVTRRYYDPYGNPLGAPPTSWPGNRGFVGGTADAATGLTNLGMREYSPASASFISTDSVLNPYQPADLNPYAYAQDNPATNSDPSGAMLCEPGGVCASLQYFETHSQPSHQQQSPPTPAVTAVPDNCPPEICGHLIPEMEMLTPAAAPIRTHVTKVKSTGTYDPYTCGRFGIGCSGFSQYLQSTQRNSSGGRLPTWLLWAGAGALTVINVVQFGADPATDGLEVADITAASAETFADAGADATADTGSTAERLAASCGGASFSADTKVLLANGTAIAIAGLRPGDKVLATNTKTGKTQPETVAAVLLHHDTNLYDLTIRTARGTEVVHTTANHLFWDSTTGRWTEAADFAIGNELRTPHGMTAVVGGGTAPRDSSGDMWDLTITADHDFYVDAGKAQVLAHNCEPEEPTPSKYVKGLPQQDPPSSTWKAGTSEPNNTGPVNSDLESRAMPRTPMQKVIFILAQIARAIHNYHN